METDSFASLKRPGPRSHANDTDSPSYDGTGTPFGAALRTLLLLTALFAANFMGRIILGPLLPGIEKDLGISHGQAGSFFFYISGGYFLSLVGAGYVSRAVTHWGAILLAGIAVGLALIAASFSEGLWSLRASVFCLGMAAGLYLPSGFATITSVVGRTHWGRAVAVHEVAPNGSFFVAPLLAAALTPVVGWRGVLMALGIYSIVVAFLFFRFGQGGRFAGEAPSLDSFSRILSRRRFWFVTLLFSLGICGSMGIYTMLPLYFVHEHGMDQAFGNTLLSLSRISGLGMSFVAGAITDRFGPVPTITGVLGIGGALTVCLGVLSGAPFLVAVFLQPMVAVCFFPAGFVAISTLASARERNVIVSLVIPLAFIVGGGLIPMLIGYAGDVDRFRWGVGGAGALMFLAGLLATRLTLDGPQAEGGGSADGR